VKRGIVQGPLPEREYEGERSYNDPGQEGDNNPVKEKLAIPRLVFSFLEPNPSKSHEYRRSRQRIGIDKAKEGIQGPGASSEAIEEGKNRIIERIYTLAESSQQVGRLLGKHNGADCEGNKNECRDHPR